MAMKTKINWIIRIKNPYFWIQVAVALVAPVLAYFGMSGESMTSWGAVLDTAMKAISNPHVCFLMLISALGTINDPTTNGFFDSKRALNYVKPHSDIKEK